MVGPVVWVTQLSKAYMNEALQRVMIKTSRMWLWHKDKFGQSIRNHSWWWLTIGVDLVRLYTFLCQVDCWFCKNSKHSVLTVDNSLDEDPSESLSIPPVMFRCRYFEVISSLMCFELYKRRSRYGRRPFRALNPNNSDQGLVVYTARFSSSGDISKIIFRFIISTTQAHNNMISSSRKKFHASPVVCWFFYWVPTRFRCWYMKFWPSTPQQSHHPTNLKK